MPQPGRRWYHIIVNTRNSWRHGDERGFRSRGHRLHSSGDYQHRPPKHEHACLRRYHEMRSGTPIRIPRDLFEPIARTMLDRVEGKGFRVLAASIDH